MPIPSQTFATLTEWFNYVNTKIIPNGQQEIDGNALNNALNALGVFIVNYTVNGNLAQINSTSGSEVVVNNPITIFTGAPTSIKWNQNVQNEYYLGNATGLNIPFSAGFSYTDTYGVSQVVLPLRQNIHIAKATNGNWLQVNNLGGSGGGGDLPPQVGNSGKFLATNGTSTFWNAAHVEVTSADFSNATDCPLPQLAAFDLIIYMYEYNNFLLQSLNQWEALPGGGFKVTLAGFDSTTINYHFVLLLKEKS